MSETLKSSRLTPRLRLLADNDGSDSDYSDKESDEEPIKDDRQGIEDTAEPTGLVFEPDNFPGMFIVYFAHRRDLAVNSYRHGA
jgi:hypothetical protein